MLPVHRICADRPGWENIPASSVVQLGTSRIGHIPPPETSIRHLLVHPVGADSRKTTATPPLGENELRIDFKRDTGFNPLPKGCGEGFTVEVHASDEDIDANLPIKIPRSGY